MTHPFHPFHGPGFQLVEIKPVIGVAYVQCTGDDGALCSLRQAWTSVASEDPIVSVGSGRSAFRVSDLLALGALLDSLDDDGRAGMEIDGGAETVKETSLNM